MPQKGDWKKVVVFHTKGNKKWIHILLERSFLQGWARGIDDNVNWFEVTEHYIP